MRNSELKYLKLGLMYGMVAAPRPFSWSPKVCFTATIPYMAENSTMEIIYTPAYIIIYIIIMHSKAKEEEK